MLEISLKKFKDALGYLRFERVRTKYPFGLENILVLLEEELLEKF